MKQSRDLTRRSVLGAGAATLAAPFLSRSASAQSAWPARPVKVIVPYPAGGGADTTRAYLLRASLARYGASSS